MGGVRNEGSGDCEYLLPSRFEIPQHYKQELFKSGQLNRDLNSEQAEQYRRQYLEKSAEPVLKAIEIVTSWAIGYIDDRLKSANFQHFTLQPLEIGKTPD
jgi:hypothetical protein